MRPFPLVLLALSVVPLHAQELARAREPAERAPQTDRAPVRITGSVVGADGRPIAVSHVHLYRFGSRQIIATVPVGPDGSYVLETDTTGVLSLWFTGVDHLVQQRPLLLTGAEKEIRVDARLGPHAYLDDLSGVTVIGDFNDFAFSDGAIPMEPQGDGTYAVEVRVEADTLAYQLYHVAEGHSINGTQSDRYVYDGDSDYRSVLDVEGGVARIVFDPKLLVTAGTEGWVRFADEDGLAARFARFSQQLDDTRKAFFELQKERKDAGATRKELGELFEEFDASADQKELEKFLASTEDPEVRAILYVTFLGSALKKDTLVARNALAEVPPDSRAWSLMPFALPGVIYGSGKPEAYESYVLEMLRENRDEGVRTEALTYLLWRADSEKDEERLRLLYTWLVSEYPESFAAKRARARFDPNRAIQPGNPVPAFTVTSLEDSTVTYSSEGLLGKTYLIDFWAVWCGPCIGEMEYLHAAYEKYRRDGFVILSLSFDTAPEDVTKFRAKGKWPMPWLHAYLPKGFESDLARQFNVIGIPSLVLVGPDGAILATSTELRGERLDRTLAGVFGREPTASPEEPAAAGGDGSGSDAEPAAEDEAPDAIAQGG